MAELDVQPKKKTSILPWLLLGLGALLLIFFLTRGDDKDEANRNDTTTTYNSTSDNAAVAGAGSDWNGIDFSSPATRHDEVSSNSVTVRGGSGYSIYGLGEDVLFETGSATLKSNAEENLRQIATSINQRYNGGEVRIFGHADARGEKDDNMQLSQQRAETVRNWLVQNGNIQAGSVSLHPMGEQRPQASNSTESGRQQNRRVDIVARSRQ